MAFRPSLQCLFASITVLLFLWGHTDLNRGPSACKADALNQLSYTPNIFMNLRTIPSSLIPAPAFLFPPLIPAPPPTLQALLTGGFGSAKVVQNL